MLFPGDTPILALPGVIVGILYSEQRKSTFVQPTCLVPLPTAVTGPNGTGITINLASGGVYMPVCELQQIRDQSLICLGDPRGIMTILLASCRHPQWMPFWRWCGRGSGQWCHSNIARSNPLVR
jgi:hypothetical protein